MLLNDPTYVEAARVFAALVLQQHAQSNSERFRWAWQRALQRDPRPEELQTVQPLLEQQLAVYRKDPDAAHKLLKTGLAPLPKETDPVELAAWTHIARVLLNLHEGITRS